MAKILVVDDDPDFVEIMRTILQKEGHEIATAGNGDQAFQLMQKDKPDLVLLDIMMSYVLDGLNLTRQMRMNPKLKDIPILMVTSLTGAQTTEMHPSDNYVAVDGWLSKPVQPKELIERVNALLGQRVSK